MQVTIEVMKGDITQLVVDAIVNAANFSLRPGGGVCGAIHKASGPDLAKACSQVGTCNPGMARLTKGYNLPAKFVIHAVGPVWRGGTHGERDLLGSCYLQALILADEFQLKSIAFPCISTGIYAFPEELAVPIAVGMVLHYALQNNSIERVIFCCLTMPMKSCI
jgi:O-acetyl-ADP-ribose deacetylase (regulator of RNase III)